MCFGNPKNLICIEIFRIIWCYHQCLLATDFLASSRKETARMKNTSCRQKRSPCLDFKDVVNAIRQRIWAELILLYEEIYQKNMLVVMSVSSLHLSDNLKGLSFNKRIRNVFLVQLSNCLSDLLTSVNLVKCLPQTGWKEREKCKVWRREKLCFVFTYVWKLISLRRLGWDRR